MKALNFIASICFICLSIACIIGGAAKHNYWMIAPAFICLALAYVAWQDYKKCVREEG